MRSSAARPLAILLSASFVLALASPLASAAEYKIDPSHSFVQFRTKHLGYSWLIGRFNDVEGSFSYDAAAAGSSAVNVTVKTSSLDSNHVKRDKHLRGEDFLDADKYPLATFTSTAYVGDADGGTISGELSLHGVTKAVEFAVKKIGEGKDPWGGYRAGFEGVMSMTRADFGIDYNLGPSSEVLTLELFVEGIRQ